MRPHIKSMVPEQTLANHAAQLAYHHIGGDARASAKRLLLDALMCTLAGLRSAECQRLVLLLAKRGGAEQASVAGLSRRIPAPTAATLNAALGHWYEWDDVYDPAALHPGMVIWPVVLATAEAESNGGAESTAEEIMAAAIAAYDVAAALGDALICHLETGWMPSGIVCTVAAAGAAARLRGLGVQGILSAMGIASAGVGLSRQALDDRVMGKNILCALAVSRAMEAADMAAAGITGAVNFITGPFGLAPLVSGGQLRTVALANSIDPGSGVRGTSLKPFPSCRVTHPAIDLSLNIYDEARDQAASVESILVNVPRPMAELCGKPFEPAARSRVAAQFSIPYTVALALHRGRVVLSDFEEDEIGSDPAVLELAARVQVQGYAVAAGQLILGSPVEITVTHRNGLRRTLRESRVKGSPAKPMTEMEFSAKRSVCSSPALSTAKADALHDAVAAIEIGGFRPITELLRAAGSGLQTP